MSTMIGLKGNSTLIKITIRAKVERGKIKILSYHINWHKYLIYLP